jgi:DICT domain-containing protein
MVAERIVGRDDVMTGEFNISPEFSVYRLVQRARENVSVLNHRRTMSIISYEIENASLIDHARTTIFAGFQRYSRFLPQLDRYTRLAQEAKQIYVFGEPDAAVPEIDHLMFVPLKPGDQLMKEWFLVSYSEQYFSALATEEVTHIDDADSVRQFKGIWTFDLDLVSILYTWLAQTVGQRTELNDPHQHSFQQQAAFIARTLIRLTGRLDEKSSARPGKLINQEVRQMLAIAAPKQED